MTNFGKPRVVVGLVTYNRAEGMARMARSLMAQTYPHIKIVICDNASPDPKAEQYGRELEAEDSRVRYTRNPQNLGETGNFRRAYELAGEEGAEYFLWAADDDYFHPEYIEHSLNLIAANPSVSAAMPSPCMMNSKSEIIYKYPGFSRFTHMGVKPGSLRKYMYLNKFLWDPIVKGKGTLPYLLFRYSEMAEMMGKFSDVQLKLWGGDNAMLYAFLKNHEIVCSDKVLMDKCFPTQRTHYWFPLAWSYQPLPKRIAHTRTLFMAVADTWGERLQIRAYIAGLWLFWLTIGYPAMAVSYALRLVDDKVIPLSRRIVA